MSTINLSNSSKVPQPESYNSQSPELSFYDGEPYLQLLKFPRCSPIIYPNEPGLKDRNRNFKSHISLNGRWFINCPRCGRRGPELWLEPLSVYARKEPIGERQLGGIDIVVGIFCGLCQLTDCIRIQGWRRMTFIPW